MENNMNIDELLIHGTKEQVDSMLRFLHPADILDVIHRHDDQIKNILSKLPDEMIADIIEEEELENKYNLLKQISEPKRKSILEEMASDEITDMIGTLEEQEAFEVMNSLDEEDKHDIQHLMSYSQESAGGIMDTDFIAIYQNKTVQQTLEYLKKECQDIATASYLYVVENDMRLKGVLSLRDLVFSGFDTPISNITNTNVISINVNMDQEEVAKIFDKYNFVMMPVVDNYGRILGIITFDDVIDVIKEEATEDMYHLGGVAKEERVDGSIKESIKSRLPWLIVNLVTALIASSVIDHFQDTISKVVALSAVMTIISGMGGNAGTQALTIVVRGISLGEINKENLKKIMWKEICVGALTGLVVAVFVSILALKYDHNIMFGVLAGIAMVMNMIMANFAGFIVPVILEKLKVDPALASGVFVTTVTDVLGFFFFLGLATLFIKYLI